MEADIKRENYALKLFQKATKNLFSENIEDAYVDLNRLVSNYDGTHIAFKGWFLLGMIWKMKLYTQCILTENFSVGLKTLKKNALLDIFNKDCQAMIQKYELHSAKRKQAYENLRKIIIKLLEIENYAKVNMYINFQEKNISECESLKLLDEIREGHIYPDNELDKLINDISYYLLITILADDFDIEFTDELSSVTRRKLNRVDFYHSCLTWLKKFYEYYQDPVTAELIKKCASIVLALTRDTDNFKRREAYETISKMSENYYSMVSLKNEIVEIDVLDVEDQSVSFDPLFTSKKGSSLMDLVAGDDRCKPLIENYSLHDSYKLALEINLEPYQEVVEAQEEFHNAFEEEKKDNSFDLKLEFD